MPLLVVELPDPHDLPAQRQNLLDILVTSLCPVVHWGDILVDTTRFGKGWCKLVSVKVSASAQK